MDDSLDTKEIPFEPSAHDAPPQEVHPYWYSLMEKIGHINAIMECMEQRQEMSEQHLEQIYTQLEEFYLQYHI